MSSASRDSEVSTASRDLILAILFFTAIAGFMFWPSLVGDDYFFPAHTDLMRPWRGDLSAGTVRELERQANPALTDKLWLYHPDNTLIDRAI